MRITAGKHRSRVLKSLEGDNTRPTTDKVKEAVFSKLGPYFEGGSILDLFGGSGAISLEAISRGFDRALIIEKNKAACNVIRENVRLLKENDNVELWNCSYQTALERLNGEKFDIIYADPPYGFLLATEIIKAVYDRDLLMEDGYLVLETSREEKIEACPGMIIEKDAVYGITKVTYVRKEITE